MKRILFAIAALICFAVVTIGHADEGMWTFDNPPKKILKDKYSFDPPQEWYDSLWKVRVSGCEFKP